MLARPAGTSGDAMRADPIAAVEAAWNPVTDFREWLQGAGEAVMRLAGARGGIAIEFDARALPERKGIAVRVGEAPSAMLNDGLQMESAARPELIRALFAPSPTVAWALDLVRGLDESAAAPLRGYFEKLGLAGALGVRAVDFDGHGIVLSYVWEEEHRQCDAGMRRTLEPVAAHLTTALRLRRSALPPDPHGGDVEAVLDGTGRVRDARGEATPSRAREALAESVRRIAWARGRARRAEPEKALRVWRGLVDGTWSLVDHVESDGRRWVLARRNPPGVPDPKALSPRERDVLALAALGHSNKYVGYMLGLAPSTVAGHLAVAQRKLGLRSRSELIGIFGAGRRER
jgi:DNA-binding CsgD family transcriptional regulator